MGKWEGVRNERLGGQTSSERGRSRVHTQVTAEFSPRMGRGYFKNLGGTWGELWIRNPFPNQMDMNGHKTL